MAFNTSALTALVGVPFCAHGRDERGCDCWGLVRLAYQRGWNVNLPSWETGYADQDDIPAISALMAERKRLWRRVAAVEPGAVLLWQIEGACAHVAVALTPRSFLHADPKRGVTVDWLDRQPWAKRKCEVYHYDAG
jgi:cell wall-associated NlpC family hydrolase